jgi:predicted Zn-dependent protease
MQLAGDRTIAPELLVANIVNTLLTLGRLDEARAEVMKVLAAIPEDPAMLALLAQVEFASKRDDEVLRAGLAAVAKDPRQAGAWKYVGLVRARRGDLQGALTAFRAAAATNILDPVVYAELGRTEERAGNRAEACAAYSRASALAGNPWASGIARQALARLGCR